MKPAVMAWCVLVMAVMACGVEFQPPSSMTGIGTPAPIPVSVPPAQTPMRCVAKVNAAPGGDGALNLRTGPGTSNPVILTLHDSEVLTVDGQTGDWYEVHLERGGVVYHGYVSGHYVEPSCHD